MSNQQPSFTLSLVLFAPIVPLTQTEQQKMCRTQEMLFGNVEIRVLIYSRSLRPGFPGMIKHVIRISFWQSSLPLQAEVSMCIVSKRVIAFSLPFEIFIYIPILPHQRYNFLFQPRRFLPPHPSSCHLSMHPPPFFLFCSCPSFSTYSVVFLHFLPHLAAPPRSF